VREADLGLDGQTLERSVHTQESGDLHTLAATFIMWRNNVQ